MTDRIPARLRGVYYLFYGDSCVYVGSSVNILRRISQHVTDGDKQFDSFAYHAMPNDSQWDIETFEIQEIRRLKPQFNVVHNSDNHAHMPILERIAGEQTHCVICSKRIRKPVTNTCSKRCCDELRKRDNHQNSDFNTRMFTRTV